MSIFKNYLNRLGSFSRQNLVALANQYDQGGESRQALHRKQQVSIAPSMWIFDDTEEKEEDSLDTALVDSITLDDFQPCQPRSDPDEDDEVEGNTSGNSIMMQRFEDLKLVSYSDSDDDSVSLMLVSTMEDHDSSIVYSFEAVEVDESGLSYVETPKSINLASPGGSKVALDDSPFKAPTKQPIFKKDSPASKSSASPVASGHILATTHVGASPVAHHGISPVTNISSKLSPCKGGPSEGDALHQTPVTSGGVISPLPPTLQSHPNTYRQNISTLRRKKTMQQSIHFSHKNTGQHIPGLSVSLRQLLETNVLSEAEHLTQQELYYYMLMDDSFKTESHVEEEENSNLSLLRHHPKVITENIPQLERYLDEEIQNHLDKFLKQWTRMQSVIGITLDKLKASHA